MNAEVNALRVENLDIAYRVGGRDLKVLRGLSFHIASGEAYGLVGESGSGKSTAALAAVRYLPPNGRVMGGKIFIAGRDLFALGGEELRRLRATAISMVYQDPARALNPSIRVGEQIAEVFRLQGLPGGEARERVATMLKSVRIADRESVYERYPHQLSGGMQQRIALAIALSSNPRLLILDEPTTGLDATVEAEILDLIGNLRRELSTSILFISHNLAVISRMCDRIGVLYAGALIEEGPTADIFADPRHPYTVGLLRCLPQPGRRKDHGRLDSIPGSPPAPGDDIRGCLFAPRCGLAEERCREGCPASRRFGRSPQPMSFSGAGAERWRCARALVDLPPAISSDRDRAPILEAVEVSKTFGGARHRVPALRGVSLRMWPGETLGLVGESGSGKTTLARLLLGLASPDAGGTIELDGKSLAGESRARRADQLKALQIVFQNPDSALNRSHRVRRLIGRALARLGRVPKPQRRRNAYRWKLTRSVRLRRTARSRSAHASAVRRIETARCDRARVCGGPSHRSLR